MTTETEASEAADYLSKLAKAIASPDYSAVVRETGRPFLQVTNQEAPQVSETIMASPVEGEWWFWWSWAERLTPVTDIEGATGRIKTILTPRPPLHRDSA